MNLLGVGTTTQMWVSIILKPTLYGHIMVNGTSLVVQPQVSVSRTVLDFIKISDF